MIVPFALIVPIKHLTVLAAFAVVTGLYLSFRGLSVLARKHRQNAPPSKIANALSGLVEINGVATGPNTITAPIMGIPCHLYRTTVWQQCKAASHEWEKAADETLHVPFLLDDSTGELLIEPLGADLDLQDEFHKEYDPALFLEQNKIPPAVSLFLARHGVTPVRRIRIEECCIRPESVVFIAGTVTENPGIELRSISHKGKGRGVPARVGEQLGGTDAPEVIRLSVSTDPLTVEAMTQQSRISAALIKAGIRNPDAWAAAGVAYPETSTEDDTGDRENARPAIGTWDVQSPELQCEPRVMPALVLMKGPADAPFLISWRSRREFGSTGVRQSAVMLGGGVVLTLTGLGVLLLNMHLL